jgi:hypothetical protein
VRTCGVSLGLRATVAKRHIAVAASEEDSPDRELAASVFGRLYPVVNEFVLSFCLLWRITELKMIDRMRLFFCQHDLQRPLAKIPDSVFFAR